MSEVVELNNIQAELRLGQVENGNYTAIETTGFHRAVGESIAYRDEYPAILIVASGAAAPDSVGVTIGGVARQMYSFDGNNTQERLSGSFEIPHDYAYGKEIEVHVHFRPSTTGTGNVKWFFDYEKSGVNLSGATTIISPVEKTTISAICSIGTASQYAHYVFSIGNLPDTDYHIGEKIGFNIRRNPSDGDDTYGADVLLEQISLHVPVDTAGSRQVYVK
jgi:hypothetical protein